MAARVCTIHIDGTEVSEDIYRDIAAIEVCESAEEFGSFALKLALVLRPDGSWQYLDGEGVDAPLFSPWRRLTLRAGFGDNAEVLIDGYIGGVTPRFGVDDAESHLLVWGHDAGMSMAQEEKIVAWGDRKYSEIAAQIFAAHGLEAEVEDTRLIHATDDALLIQRSDDWSFLKQLAERVGYEVYVRGGRGYFRPPDHHATPQPDLAARFGPAATNVLWFQPQLTGDLPSRVSMARANVGEKRIERTEIRESPQPPLGSRDADTFRRDRSAAGAPRVVLRHQPVGSQQEMEHVATGVRRRVDSFVTGEGELDGNRYGRALRARETVLIKGMGRTFSGAYYVLEVTHHITRTDYRQRFKVQRNSIEVAGNESFADSSESAERLEELAERRPRISVRLFGRTVAS